MIAYIRVNESGGFVIPKNLSPYKCLLVADEDTSYAWKSVVCETILGSGCKYFMAWGSECEPWHDCMGDVIISDGVSMPYYDVITTWHAGDTLNDVMFYAKFCAITYKAKMPSISFFAKFFTKNETVELINILVFHIGLLDKQAEFESAYRNAEA